MYLVVFFGCFPLGPALSAHTGGPRGTCAMCHTAHTAPGGAKGGSWLVLVSFHFGLGWLLCSFFLAVFFHRFFGFAFVLNSHLIQRFACFLPQSRARGPPIPLPLPTRSRAFLRSMERCRS